MSLIVAEYRCPVHGVFEKLVERPAPDVHLCQEDDDCHGCGGQPSAPGAMDCHVCDGRATPCGHASPWCISAPKMAIDSVPCYATVRGGDTERRPGMLDTRDLGEGKVTHEQWKAKQRDAQRTRRHKMLVDKGVISKKIQVG